MLFRSGFTSIGCLSCNPLLGVMIQKDSREEAVRLWNNRMFNGCENLSRDVDRRILDDVIFEMHMFLESDGELYVGRWYEALTSLNLYLDYDE